MAITKEKGLDPIIGVAYVFPEDIELESRVSETKVNLSFKTGKTWITVYFTPGTAKLTTEESNQAEGRLIESKFEMQIPGGSETLLDALRGICGRPVVVKLTMGSGKEKVCGGKNRKLRLQDAGTEGVQAEHMITFEYRSRKDFSLLGTN